MIDGTAGVSGRRDPDEALLDNPDALAEHDPGGMLRHTASGGAQVRESASLAAEANLAVLADEGRPRAVV
ncbi:mannose-6-phosphate isomerase, partial [Micromonospora sp. NPDC049799]